MLQDAEQPVAANQTIAKFGYPQTLLADYEHWTVLLRPQQATLGALVLACKEQASRFSDITQAAFTSLRRVTGDIEATLGQAFSYDKINYLMLMMVDPHVHFHVLPRYAQAKEFAGVSFVDRGWPGVPSLGTVAELDQEQIAALVNFLHSRWPVR
jgi:diadenosine tetraphosphate (Ap4A) HIT family hydrolase